jgi:hypothetical protein
MAQKEQPKPNELEPYRPPALLDALAAAPDDPGEVEVDERGRPLGSEEVMREFVIIPRVRLIQRMSADAGETSKGKHPPGSLVHSLTGARLWPVPGVHEIEEAGPDLLAAATAALRNPAPTPVYALDGTTVRMAWPIVVVRPYKERVLFDDQRQLACRSLPGGLCTPDGIRSPYTNDQDCAACPLQRWERDLTDEQREWIREHVAKDYSGPAPVCNENLTFLVLPALDPGTGLLSLSFARTSMKAGKLLYTYIAQGNPWGCVLGLWTEERKNDKGSYHVFAGKPVAKPARLELRQAARALYEQVREQVDAGQMVSDQDAAEVFTVEEAAGGSGPVGTSGDPFTEE